MQLIPRIYMKGSCREALKLYKEALGAAVDFILTYGNAKMGTEAQKDYILNAQIDLGGHKLHLGDNLREELINGNQVTFTLVLDEQAEVKAAFDKLHPGGKVIMEPVETFFSPCHCVLVDRFGITWQINCPKK